MYRIFIDFRIMIESDSILCIDFLNNFLQFSLEYSKNSSKQNNKFTFTGAFLATTTAAVGAGIAALARGASGGGPPIPPTPPPAGGAPPAARPVDAGWADARAAGFEFMSAKKFYFKMRKSNCPSKDLRDIEFNETDARHA